MVELADKETELIAPLIKKEEESSKNGAIENSSNDKESNKSSSFNAQQSDNLNLLEVTS